MNIDYDHSQNLHTLSGPRTTLPLLFAEQKPSSLLDVGCGTGTWLKAAMDFGIADVFGVEGVEIPADKLHVPVEKVRRQDLTRSWNLGRQFDAIICFEVAEHLESSFAATLIDALTRHSDKIYFSAACPEQLGQHHVNCQWPAYWQKLFNDRGFTCSDDVRWRIWDNTLIEPWYRQNIFYARKDASSAGTEPRIPSVIHPENMSMASKSDRYENQVKQIEGGHMTASWYVKTFISAMASKIKRHV
jgi:hypothetical protein